MQILHLHEEDCVEIPRDFDFTSSSRRDAPSGANVKRCEEREVHYDCVHTYMRERLRFFATSLEHNCLWMQTRPTWRERFDRAWRQVDIRNLERT